VVPKHGIIIAVSANISDEDAAYSALVRSVVLAVQSTAPIIPSTSDADRLAAQLRLPFAGKPENPVSESGQDVPRLAR
jgi:hypothetical protein